MEFNSVVCGGLNKALTPFKAFTQKSYGLTSIFISLVSPNTPTTLIASQVPTPLATVDYNTISGIATLEPGTTISSLL